MNPTGGAVGRRVGGQPDPDEYLLERILSRANLSEAWKRVKANRGTPGVDDMPIDDFMAYAWEHWPAIRSSIFANSYKPLPVKRVEIPKATGGTRPLGIPAVLDRLIQQVSADSEPLLRYWCRSLILAFRRQTLASVRGLSPHDAVYQVRHYIREGYRVAVDADLAKFFDTVEHDVLMARVGKKVRDKRVLKLIGTYLRAGVVIGGRLHETRKGVPQGRERQNPNGPPQC
jgi:RNA-directed DNA polymerase